MAVDLKALDSRIRRLQKLKELLADEDTRELIADPEIMGFLRDSVSHNGSSNGNGGGSKTSEDTVQEEAHADDSRMPPEGSLKRAVLDVARACQDKFDNGYIVAKMKASHYQFAASDPQVAVNQALRSLTKRKFIRLVREGSGRIPHIYKAVREEDASK